MFTFILQADLVTVIAIQVALWLFGTMLIYFFVRYSQAKTAETDHNPIDLFLAVFSAEPYSIFSSSEYSF